MINFAKAPIQPNAGQKQLITRSLGDMCALDIRPFSIVSGKGFRSLLQNVLDIGVSSKSPMTIEDLLPDQVTVKRSLRMMCIYEGHSHIQGPTPFQVRSVGSIHPGHLDG
jgi:hypothetical protein